MMEIQYSQEALGNWLWYGRDHHQAHDNASRSAVIRERKIGTNVIYVD